MYVLGINAVYHDSAACLVRDGDVIAAAEEERFNRIKHGKRPVPFTTWELPFGAIDYCLAEAGITMADVDHVAYSYDPAILLDEMLDRSTITLPLEPSAGSNPGARSSPGAGPNPGAGIAGATAQSTMQASGVGTAVAERLAAKTDTKAADAWESPWDPLFLSYIVNAPRQLAAAAPHHLKKRFAGITPDGPFQWHYVEHHLAHAASAFLPSPFDEAAIMTIDGRGEAATTTYSMGRGTTIERIGEVRMPHSLGMLYEAVTEHLGFLRSSDEYKVMALASYGSPHQAREFRQLIRTTDDGGYRVDMERLPELLGPPRARGSAFEQKHFDIAASLQWALEDAVLDLAKTLHARTGARNLVLAGGVALNCVMNARLRDEGPFSAVWVQPASGDSGTALGAALHVWAQESGVERVDYVMDRAFLGPEYSDDEVEAFLRWSKLPYRRMADVAGETADLLAEDRIVGWFQGRMEFGPRALGARSILASPLKERMRDRLNDIKDREDFRPVAPVVLEEHAAEWFDTMGPSPFMLFVDDVRPEMADHVPAIRHVDGSARLQTINRDQNPRYYDVIDAFSQRTGVPVLVNTSFNTRGEPIVCSPRDAIECFWASPLDDLVIGSFHLQKTGKREHNRATTDFGIGSPGEAGWSAPSPLEGERDA